MLCQISITWESAVCKVRTWSCVPALQVKWFSQVLDKHKTKWFLSCFSGLFPNHHLCLCCRLCCGISLYIIINLLYFLASSWLSSLRSRRSQVKENQRTKGYRDEKRHRCQGSSNLISLQRACKIMNAYAEDGQLTGRKLNKHIYVSNKILYRLDVIRRKAYLKKKIKALECILPHNCNNCIKFAFFKIFIHLRLKSQ